MMRQAMSFSSNCRRSAASDRLPSAVPPSPPSALNSIPKALFKYGIGLEDVRAALASANANSPKGTIDDGDRRYQIYANDQATKAVDYAPLVIAYRNGAAVQLSDVADVIDSVEDVRNLGLSNGQRSVLVLVFRQPGASIIDTIDAVKAELPHLQAAIPADIDVNVAIDRSNTIRASLRDTEFTLLVAVFLVTGVVYFFLRNFTATLIPAVVVPVSIARDVRDDVPPGLHARHSFADGADDRDWLCCRRRDRRS